ncbi:MAG: hypothetical protein ACK5L3_12195 [Oscillospiraceae bacterium]
MIQIDGITYNVPVAELTRKAEFLDKYAERTERGDLERELIGVYFNYQLKFGDTTDMVEYARLWNKLTEPEEFHTVVVPDENGAFVFKAYFSNVADKMLLFYKQKNYFNDLTVNFIAKSPARR